ncbi:hypothetical protein KKQ11_00255 [Pseudomonas sp. MG-2]|uniref:hypothetical protein n=1 Tax=Pseudomonas sp. MG-2 TaxID=405714 RepID=UPI001C007126|nr:hypothetical protein [Pseudomonas sp. MG-2]MBT9234253.1 hypothetical protein [Pseudomonas sp. MG-2]
MSDEKQLPPCDAEVFEKGESIGLFPGIKKEDVERLCKGLSAVTGWRIDWSYFAGRPHIRALAPAEQHQGEPVALPSCNAKLSDSHDWDQGYRGGWRACLDEIAKLGPLYTHADPGEANKWRNEAHRFNLEVERLRVELADMTADADRFARLLNSAIDDISQIAAIFGWKVDWQMKAKAKAAKAELASLRAQLAKVVKSGALSSDQHEALEAECCALSASAEPSAPVDADQFEIVSMGSNDLINGYQRIVQPDGTIIWRDEFGEFTFYPPTAEHSGEEKLRDARDTKAYGGFLAQLKKVLQSQESIQMAKQQAGIFEIGDHITEGHDLLGKGLGRLVEQQVTAEIERDEPVAWHVGGNGYDRICFEKPTDLPGGPCIQAINDQRQLIDLLKRYDLRNEDAGDPVELDALTDLATWKRRAIEAESKLRTYDPQVVELGERAMQALLANPKPSELVLTKCRLCDQLQADLTDRDQRLDQFEQMLRKVATLRGTLEQHGLREEVEALLWPDLESRPEERGTPETEPCSGCGTPGWTGVCNKCVPY